MLEAAAGLLGGGGGPGGGVGRQAGAKQRLLFERASPATGSASSALHRAERGRCRPPERGVCSHYLPVDCVLICLQGVGVDADARALSRLVSMRGCVW